MGAPGRGIPSDEVLRTAVERAWEQDDVSLKDLQAVIGLTPAGLLKFLNGSAPRPATRKRLLAWYLTQPPVESEPVLSMAEQLIRRTLPGLNDDERAPLMRGFAALARDVYRRKRTTPPRWIDELGEPSE
jgi:hypothetical protein